MAVDSYLELLTFLFGWMFYRVLWDVLTGTGLVYLPFLGLIIDHWREAAITASSSDAGRISLRNLEIHIFSALFVVVIAAQPVGLTPLRAVELTYTPPPTLTNPNPTPVTIATEDTTFGDHGFVDPDSEVFVPVWWYAVMSISAGISHATIEGLPRGRELRQTVQLAKMAQIEPISLRSEVAQFYNDCYVPSRSKYFLERPSNSSITGILNTQGNHDTDWIGSHIFRETQGYYDVFRASEPVSGWPYSPIRDTEYDGISVTYGRPYCKEWWEHSVRGLRRKIVDSVETTARDFVRNLVNIGFSFNSERYRDAAAKAGLLNAPEQWTQNVIARNNVANEGLIGAMERAGKGAINTVGLGITATLTGLVVGVLTQLLPILQAILLMCIYALLPLFLVLARYSFDAILHGAIAIFTVKFWTVLWYLVLWVDQNLMESMYPDTNFLVEIFLGNTEHAGKRVVLNIVTSLMYLGLPILWAMMMGWAGSRIGGSLEGASTPYQGFPREAGHAGASIAKRAVR